MGSIENPFLATIRLPVRNSLCVVTVGIVLHFISFFLPWISGLSLPNKIILTTIPAISMGYYLAKYYCLSERNRVLELILNTDDSWQVKMESGCCYSAVLGSVMFVHPLLTIITLSYNESKRDFIFTPEVINPTQFRRLRVRLKYSVN